MATEKIIRIKVEDSDVEMLQGELETLGATLEDVESSGKKVSKEVKNFGLSNKVISELNKLTGGWAGNIIDVADGFKDVVKGINLSKTALIATGIGAFVVILGTIVAYWDDIKNFVTRTNDALEIQKQLTDEINLALERRNQLELDNTRFIDTQTKRRLLEAKIAGASEDELTKIKRDGLEERVKIAEEYAKETDRIARLSIGADQETFEKAQKEQIKAFDELTKARLALSFFDLEGNVPKSGGAPEKRKKETKVNPLTGEEYDAEIQRISDHFNAIFELDQANKNALQESADQANERFLTSEEVAQAKRLRLSQIEADARQRIAEYEAEARVESYMLAADGFAAASELVGRETAAGKAFAVASALASTYLSAQLAYASQLSIPTVDAPVRAAIAAGVAVISGLANVKQILAVKVPGQGNGGGIGVGSATRPPSFNVVANNPQNQLNQALLEQNNEPVQAFVLEKDVTSAQEAKRNKVNASSL